MRDYLIRLTREYTDGGMDSRAEDDKDATQGNTGVICYQQYQNFISANVRSAVRVFTGEAGVTFALF